MILNALFLFTVAFYKEKQKRQTGSEADYVKSIRISPAEGTFVLFSERHSCMLIFTLQNLLYVSDKYVELPDRH